MAHTALVNLDVLIGNQIVSLLESSKIQVDLALWLFGEEYADWRFVLASKNLDNLQLFDQHETVNEILRKTISLERKPTIWIMRTSDPFVRALHKQFGKASSVEGMRLGGQYIGDRYVEDAYVYRIR